MSATTFNSRLIVLVSPGSPSKATQAPSGQVKPKPHCLTPDDHPGNDNLGAVGSHVSNQLIRVGISDNSAARDRKDHILPRAPLAWLPRPGSPLVARLCAPGGSNRPAWSVGGPRRITEPPSPPLPPSARRAV